MEQWPKTNTDVEDLYEINCIGRVHLFFLGAFGVILKFKGFHCLKVWEALLLVVLLGKGVY